MFDAVIALSLPLFVLVALLVRRFRAASPDDAVWASRRRDVWAREDMRAALRQVKRRRGRRGSRRVETAWWIELGSDEEASCPCPKCVLPLQGS